MKTRPEALFDDVLVQKYGGSSVATPEKVLAVAGRIGDALKRSAHVVVAVSAMGKTTDQLIAMAREVAPSPRGRRGVPPAPPVDSARGAASDGPTAGAAAAPPQVRRGLPPGLLNDPNDPPNLREEMCGKNRKRPAAENEDDTIAADPGADWPQSVFLPNLQQPKVSNAALLLQDVKLGEPVLVYTGTKPPAPKAQAAVGDTAKKKTAKKS